MNTRIVFFCALLSTAMIGMDTVHGANITVMNTNDNGPGSLRQALADAHDGDTIIFSVSGTISIIREGFSVRKSIRIHGPGAANLAITGASTNVFDLSPDLTVTIAGLTIRNGRGQNGGGIRNQGSTLTVLSCVFNNNNGLTGGAIANSARVRQRATLLVSGCTFSNNSAHLGGAILNSGQDNATTTVTFSTFDHNTATLAGGGIWNASQDRAGATVTVKSSTFSRNVAGDDSGGGRGGGIYNRSVLGSATVQIINSTFSGNSTTQGSAAAGGGIYNSAQGSEARLSISNSTFSGNTGGGGGGSIHNFGHGAVVTLTSTILNTEMVPSIQNQQGLVTSGGYNLSSDIGGGVLTGPGDRVNTDPKLGPLQNNGGPTDTHALLSASPAPAIDAGDPHFDPNAFDPPLIHDQRGSPYARVFNDRIDIGAFEVQ